MRQKPLTQLTQMTHAENQQVICNVSCYNLTQNVTNASFLAFLTHLTQIFSILLHLKAYKSTCNICVKCNTENMPFTEPKKNLKNQVNPN